MSWRRNCAVRLNPSTKKSGFATASVHHIRAGFWLWVSCLLMFMLCFADSDLRGTFCMHFILHMRSFVAVSVVGQTRPRKCLVTVCKRSLCCSNSVRPFPRLSLWRSHWLTVSKRALTLGNFSTQVFFLDSTDRAIGQWLRRLECVVQQQGRCTEHMM